MRQIIFILILSLVFTKNVVGQENTFIIKGNIKGLDDKTILYLEYTDDKEKIIDSTSILNGNFFFKGTIKSKAVNAIIRTSKYVNYKFFWLENSSINFIAEKGKFRDAQITGSNTQIEDDELNKSIKLVSEKQQSKVEQNFVKNNPNSIISAHLLNVYSTTWGKDMTTQLFSNLSEDLKKSNYGISILKFISLNRNLKIGDKYADFSQNDKNGKSVKLSEFEGKIILLEFWGSWCGPCRQTNAELVKINQEFKDKGLVIFAVATETSKSEWLKAIEKDKLTWTNVTDLKGDENEASLIYGVSGYPTNFLIDKNGIIIGKELNSNQLRKKLKQILEN